jgi:hypothetical protein
MMEKKFIISKEKENRIKGWIDQLFFYQQINSHTDPELDEIILFLKKIVDIEPSCFGKYGDPFSDLFGECEKCEFCKECLEKKGV